MQQMPGVFACWNWDRGIAEDDPQYWMWDIDGGHPPIWCLYTCKMLFELLALLNSHYQLWTCVKYVSIQVEVITDKFQPMYHSQMEVVQATRPASMFQPTLMTFWKQVKKHSRWRCQHLTHSPILFQCQLSDSLHLSTLWIPTVSDCMRYQRIWFIWSGCLHKWKKERSLIPFFKDWKTLLMFRLNSLVFTRMTWHFTLKHSNKHQQGFLIAKCVSENSLFSKYGMFMAMIDYFSCGQTV